jgi:hypothetical protein
MFDDTIEDALSKIEEVRGVKAEIVKWFERERVLTWDSVG